MFERNPSAKQGTSSKITFRCKSDVGPYGRLRIESETRFRSREDGKKQRILDSIPSLLLILLGHGKLVFDFNWDVNAQQTG